MLICLSEPRVDHVRQTYQGLLLSLSQLIRLRCLWLVGVRCWMNIRHLWFKLSFLICVWIDVQGTYWHFHVKLAVDCYCWWQVCWWRSFVWWLCGFKGTPNIEHLVVYSWFRSCLLNRWWCCLYLLFTMENHNTGKTWLRKLEDGNDLVQVSVMALALLTDLQSSRDKSSKNYIWETFPWNLILSLRGAPPTGVDLNVLFAAVAPFCVRTLLGSIVWHPLCTLRLPQRFASF